MSNPGSPRFDVGFLFGGAMEQSNLFDPARAEAPQYWRGYTPDTTDAEARAAFVARFGREPARIVRERGIVLAGPIPGSSDGRP